MSEDEKQNGAESGEASKVRAKLEMPDVSPEDALAAFMYVDPDKVRHGQERDSDENADAETGR